MPLYATSPSEETIRRTCFYWGVYAYRTTEQGSLSSTLYNALTTAKNNNLVEPGDIVVITAGDAQDLAAPGRLHHLHQHGDGGAGPVAEKNVDSQGPRACARGPLLCTARGSSRPPVLASTRLPTN